MNYKMHYFYGHSFYKTVILLFALLFSMGAVANDRFPNFTDTEKQWITNNPIIKFSIHEKYRLYWDSGIYPKFFKKLNHCSGLQFQPVWRNNEQIGLDQIRNGEVKFIIDPNTAFALPGLISEPIFWGQDAVISKNPNAISQPLVNDGTTLIFDRGYDPDPSISSIKKLDSADLIIKKLLSGEAQVGIMPLRLAINLIKGFESAQLHVRPFGHQPFAYRWLIAEPDMVLNSIVQKSLRSSDPIFMGDLLSIPRIGENNRQTFIDGLWILLLAGITLSSLTFILFFYQGKKQSRKEANLLAMAQEAKDANQAKSTFLATVSHDIRTPMNAVIGAQELLLRDAPLNFNQRELLKSANASAASLLGMLNQVLDLAKIEAGKFAIESVIADLKKILSEINQTFAIYANDKNLNLISFIDPNIADFLLLDPLRLRQIIHNLLSNAIKYTESGSIFFEARILVNDHAGQLIEFRVIDQGIGMKKEDIDRVQMPFEQVRSHLSIYPSSPSTGLGLSISNHLVHLMQSELIIESIPNFGTNVHFVVAFARTCSLFIGENQNQYPHPSFSFKGLRALIVEDHPASRQILLIQLQTLGILTDSCSDSEEALRKIKTNTYDLLLTDHLIPGMHGPALANKIRSMGYEDLIIVGITADIYASKVRENLINAGMNSVLIKPISLQHLESELKKLFLEKTNRQSKKLALVSEDIQILVLEEVLKVQFEVLRSLSNPLNPEELRSLVHKIKGGALLSNDERLLNQCIQIEESNDSSELIQKSLYKYLTGSNRYLEKKIQELKLSQS